MDKPDLPSEDQNAGGPDLEPMRLEVPPDADAHHGADDSQAPRAAINWTHVGKVAGLVVAVAAATTLVINERHDAAADVADSEAVNLVFGVPQNGFDVNEDDGVVSFAAQVYNAGPKDVSLHTAYPSGWADAADGGDPQRLVADTWTAVSVQAAPDCANDDPMRTMAAVVETEAGTREVAVELQPYDLTQTQHLRQSVCNTDDSPVFVGVADVAAREPQGDVLPMGLHLYVGTPNGDAGSVELSGVSTSTAGLSVEGVGLPQQLSGGVHSLDGEEPDPSEATIDVEWRITDCAEAMSFADVSIELEYPVGDPDMLGPSGEDLAPEGAVSITRFVMEQCS